MRYLLFNSKIIIINIFSFINSCKFLYLMQEQDCSGKRKKFTFNLNLSAAVNIAVYKRALAYVYIDECSWIKYHKSGLTVKKYEIYVRFVVIRMYIIILTVASRIRSFSLKNLSMWKWVNKYNGIWFRNFSNGQPK